MSEYGKYGDYGTPKKKKGHGAKGYWIVGEGYYMPDQSEPMPEPKYDSKDPGKPMPMRFCRMFDKKASSQPGPDGLKALGAAMSEPADTNQNTDIPAGMTYLGQFIDHDITLTPSEGTDLSVVPSVDVAGLPNERTASLDLDSLYGGGPGRSNFYQDDGKHFVIGPNTDLPGLPQGLLNDLPRDVESRKARIGDERNDENLAVAQTHLHFLKFHNKVLDDPTMPDDFEEARKIVRQHYQSIVLHDFTPRLVDPNVYDQVMANGRTWWMPEGAYKKRELCMPVEFSVAAYRLGHSMVRNQYEWNRIFSSDGGNKATLGDLFRFSIGSGDLRGLPTLPVNWVVDWTRLYDFADVEGVDNHPNSNKTRPIDTFLALDLGDLPGLQDETPPVEDLLRNLAVLNLLRGSQMQLPTGQDIAALIGAAPLSPAEVAAGPQGDVVKRHGFDKATPLWYYILKEAEVKHHGQHLGEVGSTIVVETFHGLVEGSEHSILKEANWAPSLKPDAKSYTMADMLAYVGELNPLGDNRTS